MAILQKNPQEAEAYFLLGALTADHNNFAKAIELFDRAISLGFQDAGPFAQKSRCLIALNRQDEAVSLIELAIQQAPKDAFTLDTIGVVLSRAGRHEESLPFYRQATALNPDVASYQYNLGAALQFLGSFDLAREAFDRCLENDPSDTRARTARASITKQTAEDNDIPALLAAWDKRNVLDVDGVLQLAHALAKSYEDLGDPASAMEWLERGKSQKRAILPNREQEDQAVFQAAKEIAGNLTIAPTAAADGPLFIVGMPRTGTTLVDRIITSHPNMTSAGELSDFSIALKRALGTPGPHVLDATTLRVCVGKDLTPVGQTYLEKVRATLGIHGRFTDKMPLNIFFAPAILAAIPAARVVCLRRHPADTVLSNYKQLFATSFSYYAYAYDLEQTARYAVAFNALIKQFETDLPSSRFKVVDYENVARDLEPQARNLLAFCGLEWDPACLNFHENAAPVATASSVQVRQPIYTSSIDRWKRYRPAMDPALAILAHAGLLDPLDDAPIG